MKLTNIKYVTEIKDTHIMLYSNFIMNIILHYASILLWVTFTNGCNLILALEKVGTNRDQINFTQKPLKWMTIIPIANYHHRWHLVTETVNSLLWKECIKIHTTYKGKNNLLYLSNFSKDSFNIYVLILMVLYSDVLLTLSSSRTTPTRVIITWK
jgi:hypothetical protein